MPRRMAYPWPTLGFAAILSIRPFRGAPGELKHPPSPLKQIIENNMYITNINMILIMQYIR